MLSRVGIKKGIPNELITSLYVFVGDGRYSCRTTSRSPQSVSQYAPMFDPNCLRYHGLRWGSGAFFLSGVRRWHVNYWGHYLPNPVISGQNT